MQHTSTPADESITLWPSCLTCRLVWVSFLCVVFCMQTTNTKDKKKILNTKGWNILLIPGCRVGRDFEATRVANELIQDADDLFELRPVVPLFLPAVQHQLVEGSRAVHGWGEAITLIYSFYYLDVRRRRQDLRKDTWDVFGIKTSNMLCFLLSGFYVYL